MKRVDRVDVLDDFQVDLVLDLVSAMNLGRQGLLVSPTGSGKTTVARVVAEMLFKAHKFEAALVLVPQNQIKDSWTRDLVVSFGEDLDDAVVLPERTVRLVSGSGWQQRTRRTTNELHRLKGWLQANLVDVRGYVSTQQGFAAWVNGGKLLPEGLTGKLLILDEAHRASLDNQLGKALRLWTERGGSVLYLTATPFRTFGNLPVSEEIPTAYRSLAEHVSSGKYSPRNIEIRFRQFSYEAHTTRVLAGDMMPSGDMTRLAKEVKDLWLEDGRPKAVVLVPQYGAESWASRLKEILEGVARVHVAVGMRQGTVRKLADLLDRERAAAREGRPSEVDIIVACRRFDEGTDWPWCCDVYNLGLPSSILRMIQVLGRTLRYKGGNPESRRRGISGYHSEHANRGRLTLLLPRNSVRAWEVFERNHRDHVFMIACFMQDVATGQHYLAEVRERLADMGRSRPSDPVRNAAIKKEIAQQAGVSWDDFHEDAKVLKVAAITLDQDNPSKEDLVGVLRERMGLSPDRIKRVLRAWVVRRAPDSPDTFKAIFRAVDANVTQRLSAWRRGGPDRRIIRESMQDAFDSMVDEVMADNTALVREARSALDLVAGITGELAQNVAGRMRSNLFSSSKSPSREEIRLRMLAFRERTGRAPSGASGVDEYRGVCRTWDGMDGVLQREGSSLRQEANLLGISCKLTAEAVRKAAEGFFEETGRWPHTHDGDATKWIGFRLTWRGVESFLRDHCGEGMKKFLGRSFSVESIERAVRLFWEDTGRRPTCRTVGGAGKYFGFTSTWSGANTHLKRLGDTLARACDRAGIPGRATQQLFSVESIERAARLFWEDTGRRPTYKVAGSAEKYFGFMCTWRGARSHLRRRGDTLARACDRAGIPRCPVGRPRSTGGSSGKA